MTQKEFDNLLEYSCSYPTGTQIGKLWKRNAYAFSRKEADRGKERWTMGEYTEHPTDPENKVGIKWRGIMIGL